MRAAASPVRQQLSLPLALRLGGVLALGLVAVGSAAHPLAHGLTTRQGLGVLAIVVPAAGLPALLVRSAEARRWVPFSLAAMVAIGLSTLLVASLAASVSVHKVKGHVGEQGRAGGGRQPAATVDHSRLTLSHGLAIALLLGVLVVVAAAIVLSRRRALEAVPAPPARPRAATPEPEEVVERFYSLLDDTLEDLRGEPDARRAVIAAYARMERGLASLGIERVPAETPLEYLARVLETLAVSAAAARRLTDLFERAKFSPARVDESMKEHAVAALRQIRDEVRACAA